MTFGKIGGIINMEVNEMFTYIKLKNFMSLGDVTFDFHKNKKKAKRFVAIYGENGSGKSNFVSSIDFLHRSTTSLITAGSDDAIKEIAQKNDIPQKLFEMLLRDSNILNYAKQCRMVDCDDNTTVEYGFQIGDKKGYYILSFADKFLYEKLYYFTGKQSGTLFEITDVDEKHIDVSFSGNLFLNKKIENDIKDKICQYWGKHTFLSILRNEIDKKNEAYMKDGILSYLFDVLNMFKDVSIFYRDSLSLSSGVQTRKPENIIMNLSKGNIKKEKEYQLNCSERILRNFFTQAYADIKDVFYERSIEKNTIKYKLFVKKMIGGKIRTISFEHESAGTQQILEIVRSLFGAFCGVTVVYDEIDNGIHDLLLKNLLLSMADDITGQLIITTHNTLLLEDIDAKSVYLINIDYEGNKEVKCLSEYPIQSSNNLRTMYIKGLFGGVPIVDGIDYDEIIDELSSDDDEGGE